jgi:glyoxylase-like metal-dependent hydrolase (beta-lactamase superfamily II)
LFAGSCGRTDLPGGSMKTILTSLLRLACLDGNLQVLPGHMETSDLDRERQTNYYMLHALNNR